MNRCSQKCRKSKLRCVLDHGHEGRCKYTPNNLLSPSTITKILLELTSGEIKSRAGLDNTDVIKGHENFERMRSMVDTLSSIIGGSEVAQKAKDLKDECKVQEFHKTNFIRHLGVGTSICTCLLCGFHDNDVDPIKCNCKDHKPPCMDCQKSFGVSHIPIHAL